MFRYFCFVSVANYELQLQFVCAFISFFFLLSLLFVDVIAVLILCNKIKKKKTIYKFDKCGVTFFVVVVV